MQRKVERINLSKLKEPEDVARIEIPRESIEELANSMNARGQLQPIGVIQKGNVYEIEYGHRRFLAAQLLNWAEIDCYVFEDSDDAKLHINRAHENLIRENLNPVEEARMCWSLVYEDDRGIEKTAALLCKTPGWIENRLDILRYPEEIVNAIAQGKIKLAVAKELARVKDKETRQRLLESTVQYGASARTVETWVKDMDTATYLENQELAAKAGQIQTLDMGQVSMQCFVCQGRYLIDYLRHVWLCPDCRSVVYQLQRATIEEMNRQEGRVD